MGDGSAPSARTLATTPIQSRRMAYASVPDARPQITGKPTEAWPRQHHSRRAPQIRYYRRLSPARDLNSEHKLHQMPSDATQGAVVGSASIGATSPSPRVLAKD